MYSLPVTRVGVRESEAKNHFLCGLIWLGRMYFYLDCPQRYKWHSPLLWVFLYVTVMTFLPMSSNRLKELDSRYWDMTWKNTTPKRNRFHTAFTVLSCRAPCHRLQSPAWFSASLIREGVKSTISFHFPLLSSRYCSIMTCAEWVRMTHHSSCCHRGLISRIADDVWTVNY